VPFVIFAEEIIDFNCGNVSVDLTVSSILKINATSHLTYVDTERERERDCDCRRISKRSLKNDFYIPMLLSVNFQGQKFDNEFNKSCGFICIYFDIRL
jgi:hypothetical protein